MLEGKGLLALWNGVDPARAAEYDLWHTREHVPERVAVPGMLSARRYVAGNGPLPQYLTLYDLEDIGVLTSAPYRRLLEQPTPWSRSMRPSFRGFLRLACRPLARLGGGAGGALIATTLGLADGAAWANAERIAAMLRGALAIPAVSGAQLAVVASDIPAVPFTIGGDMPDYPRDAVLTLEGYDREALVTASGAIAGWLGASVLAGATTAWTSYSLGYLICRADLPFVVTAAQPA